MGKLHNGSCQCGAIKFEVHGEFENFLLCHCKRCRKDTGSAHAANLFSSSAKITWLAGEDNVTTFSVPGTRHTKCFCSICGAAIPSIQMDGELLVVPAGSIETSIDIRPNAHIHVASRAGWDDHLEDILQYQDLPN